MEYVSLVNIEHLPLGGAAHAVSQCSLESYFSVGARIFSLVTDKQLYKRDLLTAAVVTVGLGAIVQLIFVLYSIWWFLQVSSDVGNTLRLF